MASTLNASMHKQGHTDSSLWSTKQVAGQPELQKLSRPVPSDLLLSSKGGRRHGYTGHLTSIANCIVHSTDKGSNGALVPAAYQRQVI